MGGDFSRAPEAPPRGAVPARAEHPPRQWEDQRDPEVRIRPARVPRVGMMGERSHGIPRGGKPHLPTDAGHPGKTEAQTEVDAKAVFKAVPHPAVRWEG